MDKALQQQIDRLLMEQGIYTPLEFLRQEGRLEENDYEQWQCGKVRYLIECLFGDPEQIGAQLIQAAEYAQLLGLCAEPIVYHAWDNVTSQQLLFSQNEALNQCFNTRYIKAIDDAQMDLFMDAPVHNLSKGIVIALTNRDPMEARRQLEQLYTMAPDYFQIGELEYLVTLLENLSSPLKDPEQELLAMQETTLPLLKSILGKDSNNLAIPCWRRLTTALKQYDYNPQKSQLHSSYAALQALDWHTVCEAVEQVPAWQADPVLLVRHAQACGKAGLLAQSLLSWFMLCWNFPDQAPQIETKADSELANYWNQFLDLEPELDISAFPAWLLISKPGLSALLSAEDKNISHIADSTYQIILEILVETDSSPSSKTAMNYRAQLQQLDPILFQYFLNSLH